MDADVVVLGAGAAGLAAAYRLACLSFRVVLVEARDRIGGRVFWKGVPGASPQVELGAEFIHGPALRTRELLKEAASTAVDVGTESWAWADGKLWRDDDRFASRRLFDSARSLENDESVDQFLARFERDEATRQAAQDARRFVEGFEAADPAIASVRSIADELHSGVDARTARPRDGYSQVFAVLYDACVRLGVDIRLATVVNRISRRRREVVVRARDVRGMQSEIRARVAVVTFPAGVLRDERARDAIVFDPDLPDDKRAALAEIETGHVAKVVMWFRTPFWEEIAAGRYRHAAFFQCKEGPFVGFWTQAPLRSNLIVAWAGGPKADAVSAFAEAELVELALKGFGTMMGELALARTTFEGGMTHDWRHDPFALGAYSYITVGGAGARAALGAPVDRTLFFAGEATSVDNQGGTVNGAFETGERAAREAADVLEAGAT
ncbi:MAG TPA: NAD(P)/FAD-dependent oxidoreductase [Candidatus Acidoferrales bacterium]|nr:NAD(P)/FAD-dependent oxidoreductase [Candidatus Acidoferrales bacterium]